MNKPLIGILSATLITTASLGLAAQTMDAEGEKAMADAKTMTQHHNKHRGAKHHRGKHHGNKMMRSLEKLDLSDAQSQQIKALMQTGQEDRAMMKKARHENHQAIHQLVMAETFDRAAAEALVAEQADLRAQRMLDRIERQHAVMQVLSTEQRAQLEAMKAERKARHQAHHEARESTTDG